MNLLPHCMLISHTKHTLQHHREIQIHILMSLIIAQYTIIAQTVIPRRN